MYSIKENVKAAIMMSILGTALVAITSYLYFGYTVSTEGMFFLLFHGVAGVAAIVFAVIMIINCVIDFRRASRRMRVVSSSMYKMEESLLRKTA